MSLPDIRNEKDFLSFLWRGWRVCDDERYCRILLFSADRQECCEVSREVVQAAICDGYAKRVIRLAEPMQPGMVLTDDGLKHLGLPTESEQKAVR